MDNMIQIRSAYDDMMRHSAVSNELLDGRDKTRDALIH